MQLIKYSLAMILYIVQAHCKSFTFRESKTCAKESNINAGFEFKTVTENAIACVRLCSEHSGCGGTTFYTENKTCIGAKKGAESLGSEPCVSQVATHYTLASVTASSATTTQAVSVSTTTIHNDATAATTSAPTSNTAVCPSGWISVGTSCYYTPGLDDVMQYSDARDYCSGLDGYLMQLETETENDAMKQYLLINYGPANWCIGLSDIDVEGSWVWMTGYTSPVFYDWLEPPDGGQRANFGMLKNTTGWVDVDRSTYCVVVCEKAP